LLVEANAADGRAFLLERLFLFLHDGQRVRMHGMRELPVVLLCRICENRKQTYFASTSPQHEGRIGRSSRHVGRVAMDAKVREMMRTDADGKGVWS
jgi:hypothetical protein